MLRDRIVKGYTVNEQRLKEESAKLLEMQRTVDLLACTLENRDLVSETGRDVLRVIGDYAYALTLLIADDRRKPARGEGHHRQGDRQPDQPEELKTCSNPYFCLPNTPALC